MLQLTQPMLFMQRKRYGPQCEAVDFSLNPLVIFKSKPAPALKLTHTPLEDMKPWSDTFKPMNFTKQVILMAGANAINVVGMEYNMHELKQSQKPEDERVEFDWASSLERGKSKFLHETVRLFFINQARKAAELISHTYLSVQTTDLLTKDVYQSLQRKLHRGSRTEACKRIFHTCLWSNATLYMSMLAFDLAEHTWLSWCRIYQHVTGKSVSKDSTSSQILTYFQRLAMISIKKSVIYLVGWASAAGGYALGAYIHPGSAFLFGALSEAIVCQSVQSLLGP